jgi:FRG domain-containing protein
MSKLRTFRATNLAELVKCADAIRHELSTAEMWWRGHSDRTWRLLPSVHRLKTEDDQEYQIARLFMQRAPTRRLNCPAHSDIAGWMFLMQHYRLPTRLLDWTESILVAAFFATAPSDGSDGAIWGLSPFFLNETSIGDARTRPSDDRAVRELMMPAFDPATVDKAQVIAFIPDEVDVRMLVQQSVFTIHGAGKVIESSALPKRRLLRLISIPHAAKDSLRHELGTVGIRRSTLFPDLESLAADVAERYLGR